MTVQKNQSQLPQGSKNSQPKLGQNKLQKGKGKEVADAQTTGKIKGQSSQQPHKKTQGC